MKFFRFVAFGGFKSIRNTWFSSTASWGKPQASKPRLDVQFLDGIKTNEYIYDEMNTCYNGPVCTLYQRTNTRCYHQRYSQPIWCRHKSAPDEVASFSASKVPHPGLQRLKRFIYSGVVLMALTYQLIWNEIVKTYKVIFYVNVTQTNCELCHIFHCFNESVRHTRGVVLWVSTLEYSRSIGPQFDLIKFNSSTLYFASGLFPLCLNNNCSAVELWSPCLSYEKGISAKSWRKKKKSLMISTAALCGRGKRRSVRVWCTRFPFIKLCHGFLLKLSPQTEDVRGFSCGNTDVLNI